MERLSTLRINLNTQFKVTIVKAIFFSILVENFAIISSFNKNVENEFTYIDAKKSLDGDFDRVPSNSTEFKKGGSR